LKFLDLTKEAFCRAMCRYSLRVDGETNILYVGVMPDDLNPGRLDLSRVIPYRNGEPMAATYTVGDGLVRLECEGGWAELALALPNKLVVRGEGLSLLFGNGKAAKVFMGGGSAVKDSLGGALLSNANTKLRFLNRVGSVETTSAWNLEALSDPDPRLYLHPDEDGKLEAVIFESDYDEVFVDDGVTVAEAAADMAADWQAFLAGLKLPTVDDTLIHAAYNVWTALLPARVMFEQRIKGTEYVEGRQGSGMATLKDSALVALLLKDKEAAAARLCSFLQYTQVNGLVPRKASNKTYQLEAEAPLFGYVLNKAGLALTEEQYQAMVKALGWWREERWCPERKLFYYLHRYEPGCCAKLPFPATAPLFAPDLNALMILWLDELAKAAAALGKADEAAELAELKNTVLASLLERLWKDGGFVFMDILDEIVLDGHPRALLPIILGDLLPAEVYAALAEAVPAQPGEDAVFLALSLKDCREKKAAIADALRSAFEEDRSMSVRLAAELLLAAGAAQ